MQTISDVSTQSANVEKDPNKSTNLVEAAIKNIINSAFEDIKATVEQVLVRDDGPSYTRLVDGQAEIFEVAKLSRDYVACSIAEGT